MSFVIEYIKTWLITGDPRPFHNFQRKFSLSVVFAFYLREYITSIITEGLVTNGGKTLKIAMTIFEKELIGLVW